MKGRRLAAAASGLIRRGMKLLRNRLSKPQKSGGRVKRRRPRRRGRRHRSRRGGGYAF